MFEKMKQKSISLGTLFLIFLMLCLCFTPIFSGQNKGGDSPEAVFKVAQKAGAKKDFGTLAKLVAPTEHAMLSFGTDMAVGMFLEFYEGKKGPELKKKYQKIQAKFKIKEKDNDKKLKITQDTPQEVIDAHIRKRAQSRFGHVDAAKYVPALMGLVVNMPEMADQAFVPQEKLSDLKIDGDHATGKAGEKSVSFIREGGRWYLASDIMD